MLDCESRETTVRSLATAYGVSEDKLVSAIRGVDLDAIYNEHPDIGRPNDALAAAVLKQTGQPLTLPQRVCWFHITRTLPNSDFRDGISPLGGSLERVWAMLAGVLAGTEHANNFGALRDQPLKNFQYNLKTANPIYAGPYAMLVREAAFRPTEMGNHDYLSLPEIVEDICRAYQARFGTSIIEIIRDNLRPCIVKFKEDVGDEHRVISLINSASYYIYLLEMNEDMTVDANDNFDGRNHTVPFEDVISVSFV